MNIPEFSKNYIGELCGLLDRFDMERFQQLVEKLLDAYHDAHGIFVMGNGGSAATASHFACDINKGCCLDLKKKFRVICLNDSLPTIMALANDLDYAAVFVEQLKNFLFREIWSLEFPEVAIRPMFSMQSSMPEKIGDTRSV